MDYLHLVEEHISEQTSFLQFDYKYRKIAKFEIQSALL